MSRHDLDATGILDDACLSLSRVAAPWLGVFWLTQIPFRFLQVLFVDEILELGPVANRYGHYLTQISLLTFLAFLPAALGRLAWVRAVALGLSSRERLGARPLRIPPVQTASYLYTALVLEVLFLALVFTAIVPLAVLFVSGLAPATAHRTERPHLLRPLLEILRPAGRTGPLLRLALLCLLGWILAAFDVNFAFQAGGALIASAGIDLAEWSVVLSFENRLYALLVAAGSVLAIEPIWLACCTVFVHRFWSQETGEDLRIWFEEIRSEGSR